MARPRPASILDRALDLTVLPGYSRLGPALRGLSSPAAQPGELNGRVALVTGASSGLGEAVCEGLALAGAEVQMVVRDIERGKAAVSRIEARAPGASARLQLERCDISSLADIRSLAEGYLARHERLDVLVHNAGVLPPERRHTAEGIELTFATNVLGPFLLTSLLLPALAAAAPSRVITVASGGMYTARLDAEDPQLDDRDFDGAALYAHTKRAEVALNREWSERHFADGVAFHSMHPGWADTAGLRTSLPRFHRVMRPLLRDARQGADTVIWLAAADGLEPVSGGFWHDRRPRPEHRLPRTRETAADRARLWAYCEGLSTLSEQNDVARPAA